GRRPAVDGAVPPPDAEPRWPPARPRDVPGRSCRVVAFERLLVAGDGVALAAHGGQQLAEILRGGSPAPWIALLGRCLLETDRILRDDAVRVRGGGGRDAKARAGARDLTRGRGGGRCPAPLSRPH